MTSQKYSKNRKRDRVVCKGIFSQELFSSRLHILFPFQHQYCTLRDDKIFFTLIDYFCRTAKKENGNIPFSGLKGNVLDLVVFILPGLPVNYHRYGVPGPGFDYTTLAHLFVLLYPRWKV